MTIDEESFEAFMLAVHEYGTSGMGYRKCLEKYEQAKKPSPANTAPKPFAKQGYRNVTVTPAALEPQIIIQLEDGSIAEFPNALGEKIPAGATIVGGSWFGQQEAKSSEGVGELPLPGEAERQKRWADKTDHLPPLPKLDDGVWLWTDSETEMLRAAMFARFGESARTESLFKVAATGIRIYLSRINQQPIERQGKCGEGEVVTPTEEMCDRARWFILARDSNIYTWGGLSRCIDKTIPYIQDKIDNKPLEHITKWDFAECVYLLMTTTSQQEAREL